MYHLVGIARRFDADVLLEAYASGCFPMADERGTIHWITSDPRFVLPIGGLHVPRSLARLARRAPFELRVDRAFRRVMEHCARDRSEENANWISPRMIDAYCELHRRGRAHSVEAWLGGVLVGGLYGVALGGAFFGESMFVRPDLGGTDASKLCLLELDRRLQEGGFELLDSQEANDHLRRFGGVEIPLDDYLARLGRAIAVDARLPGAATGR